MTAARRKRRRPSRCRPVGALTQPKARTNRCRALRPVAAFAALAVRPVGAGRRVSGYDSLGLTPPGYALSPHSRLWRSGPLVRVCSREARNKTGRYASAGLAESLPAFHHDHASPALPPPIRPVLRSEAAAAGRSRPTIAFTAGRQPRRVSGDLTCLSGPSRSPVRPGGFVLPSPLTASAAAIGQLTFPPVTVGDMMPVEANYALSQSLGLVSPAYRGPRGY
jgi:hypothetical protein